MASDNDRIIARLDLLMFMVANLTRKVGQVMATLDDLQAQVEVTKTVEQSALVLIQGIAAKIAAAGGDPVKIQAIADQLKASEEALAAAVTANT